MLILHKLKYAGRRETRRQECHSRSSGQIGILRKMSLLAKTLLGKLGSTTKGSKNGIQAEEKADISTLNMDGFENSKKDGEAKNGRYPSSASGLTPSRLHDMGKCYCSLLGLFNHQGFFVKFFKRLKNFIKIVVHALCTLSYACLLTHLQRGKKTKFANSR